MIDNIDKLIEDIKKHASSILSKSRFEHSVRTAEMAYKLCKKYLMDEKKGYLAGISHDICKELPSELLISIASRDGEPISLLEKEKPGLLHGRAAAVKLQEDFNVYDKDIIEAVSNHTFGKLGMCDLAKVLYVADKIEPGRPHVNDEYFKKLKKMNLNELVKTVLGENIEFLKKKGKKVSPETERLYLSISKN